MAVEVKEDSTTHVLTVYPDADVAPASATAACYDPENTAVGTPAVAVDTAVATTVGTVTNRTQFTVASATGIVAGRKYLLGLDGGSEAVEVERVDGSTIYLAHEPSDLPRNGDTFKGLACVLTLPAAATAERGKDFRVELDITLADSSHAYEQVLYHVVAMPLGRVVTAHDVADILEGYGGGGQRERLGPRLIRRVADAASERVRSAIEQHDRYPHLYGSRSAFIPAGLAAIRVELATRYGIRPAGTEEDISTFIGSAVADFDREMSGAVARLHWYDNDDDRTPSTPEQRGMRFAELRL